MYSKQGVHFEIIFRISSIRRIAVKTEQNLNCEQMESWKRNFSVSEIQSNGIYFFKTDFPAT